MISRAIRRCVVTAALLTASSATVADVRYLTPGDLTEDVDGNVVLTPRQSRADMLVIRIGVTITPWRAR